MLLDTTFLIDILRGKDLTVLAKAREMEARLENKGATSISIMELWKGAVQSNRAEHENEKINQLLSLLFIYPFDEQEAKKAGEIEGHLARKGEIIELEDIMIAAVAIVHHEPLLTRNGKHFQRIPELQVEEY